MSVTAVPLQPLSKGTVAKLWVGILLVVLLGVGLAWVGTSRQQLTTTDNGLRYRAFVEGEGDPIAPGDAALARLESRGPDGRLLSPPGQPGPVTVDDLPPPLRPIFLQMRKGGSYQVYAPVRLLLAGQPLPPGAPVRIDDNIQFRFDIIDIERGGAEQMRMMQSLQGMQGGGGMGAPGPGAGAGAAPGGPGGPAPMSPPPGRGGR